MANNASLMVPVVHKNGTSKEGLIEQTMEVVRALNVASTAISNAMPHGRDYYPRDKNLAARPSVYFAIDQYSRILASLAETTGAFEELAIAISEQENNRG